MGVCTSKSQEKKIQNDQKQQLNDSITPNDPKKKNIEIVQKLSQSLSSQKSSQQGQKQKLDLNLLMSGVKRKRGSIQTDKKSHYSHEASENTKQVAKKKGTFKVNIALKCIPFDECFEMIGNPQNSTYLNNQHIVLRNLITRKLRIGKILDNTSQTKELIDKILELQLFHPRLLNIIEILEHENKILIVKEYIEPKLLNEIESENTIECLKEIIEVVEYLHSKNIVHGYLTKQSFLLDSTTNKIKLIDIEKVMEKPKHTIEEIKYFSPEACNKINIYTQQRDIWAIGIIGIQLFINQEIFPDSTIEQIQKTIVQSHDIILSKKIEQINQFQLQDLLKSFLQTMPRNRIKLSKALQSHIFQSKILFSKKRVQTIIKKICQLKQQTSLFQCLSLYMIKNVCNDFNEDNESHLFFEMDYNNDGKVNSQDLIQFLKVNNFSENEINTIQVDIENKDEEFFFDFNEYIVSIFYIQSNMQEEQLQEAFSQLTNANSGITLSKMLSLFPHREIQFKQEFQDYPDKIILFPMFKQIMQTI